MMAQLRKVNQFKDENFLFYPADEITSEVNVDLGRAGLKDLVNDSEERINAISESRQE